MKLALAALLVPIALPAQTGPTEARAAFENGEAQRKTGHKAEAIESYNLFLELSSSNDPNRREGIQHLKELGAPYEH